MMNERETPREINDQAADWVARLDASGDDAMDHAELRAWLAADGRRRGAFLRAQAAWSMLDRARILKNGGITAASTASGPPRRGLIFGGLAAAAAAIVVVFVPSLSTSPPVTIETAVGEIRRVPLADGSVAAVNTQSRLAIRLKPAIREVTLAEGEAWFRVAHDSRRPFIVAAGDIRVRAVGTAFSVRRTPEGAAVQVTDGVVQVWSVDNEVNKRFVAAGARAIVTEEAGPSRVEEAEVDIDRKLAWRAGQIIFEGDTLAAAVAELNRYNSIQVRIADSRLAGERFVGRFRTNEPAAFARAVGIVLDARVETRGDTIVLSRP